MSDSRIQGAMKHEGRQISFHWAETFNYHNTQVPHTNAIASSFCKTLLIYNALYYVILFITFCTPIINTNTQLLTSAVMFRKVLASLISALVSRNYAQLLEVYSPCCLDKHLHSKQPPFLQRQKAQNTNYLSVKIKLRKQPVKMLKHLKA